MKNSNPQDKNSDSFQKFLNTGLTEEQVMKKFELETQTIHGTGKLRLHEP